MRLTSRTAQNKRACAVSGHAHNSGQFSCANSYDCYRLRTRNRTSIAPMHVIPAPSTYTKAEPPSGTGTVQVVQGDGLGPPAKAAGAKHNRAPAISANLRLIFF